jgi:diguanylate cyclase (GGDEF)-like protein
MGCFTDYLSLLKARWARTLRHRRPGPEASLDRFAAYLRQPRAAAEVRMVVVHLAQRISGARRVELEIERGAGPCRVSRVVARWPVDGGGEGDPGRRHQADREHPPLCLPLRVSGVSRGMLRLYPASRGWRPQVLDRLTTLSVLAAGAEVGGPVDDDLSRATRDPLTGTHNLPFLFAFLTHAQALARRRREPLSLLCVAIEGLATGSTEGEVVADAALQRAAQAVMRSLRSSDVVARLDPLRLAVVLPATGIDGSHTVAELIRRAVAESGVTSGTNPGLTASVGTATYPVHATEPGSLLAAAREALARASAGGMIAQIHCAQILNSDVDSLILSRN